MYRHNPDDLRMLWTEFMEGLNQGPSIVSLEEMKEKEGVNWRRDNGETQFFLRRESIIKRIKLFLQEAKSKEAMSEDAALEIAMKRAKTEMINCGGNIHKYGVKLKADEAAQKKAAAKPSESESGPLRKLVKKRKRQGSEGDGASS